MNYSDMSDDELRLAIARARGWIFVDEAAFVGVPDNSGLSAFQPCPNYATDLNAAFELVREAEGQNVGFSLHNVTHKNRERVTYEATFYDPWGGPACEEYTAYAATPARAICEAWLAWHEAKEVQR